MLSYYLRLPVSDSRGIFLCPSLTVIRPVPPPSLPSAALIELNCFIHDDDHRHNVFSIKIARTESVSTLKKAIKEENPESFRGVDARSLHLWNVSITVDDDFKDSVSKVELRDEEELSAVDTLSDLFSKAPGRKYLHIIVRSPPASKFTLVVSLSQY
jgi:hypothetical protein